MVNTLKRRREPVSYKEPSSEEDYSSDSAAEGSSKRKRIVPQKRSTRLRRSDSPVDSEPASTEESQDAPPAGAVHLRQRRKVSYRESSVAEESDPDFEVQKPATPRSQKPKAQQRAAPRSPYTREKKKSSRTQSRAIGAAPKPKKGILSQRRRVLSSC